MKALMGVTLWCVTWCVASLAFADVIGQYQMPQGMVMQISYKDDQHIRMDMGEGNYMLVSGEKIYMVNNDGGEKRAMDMSQMGRMMSQLGARAPMHSPAAPETRGDVSFQDTGRTETVAGIPGKVFQVTAQGHAMELVLTNNPDVKKLNRAFMKMAANMAQSMGAMQSQQMEQAIQQAEKAGMGGVLRQGDMMKLISVKSLDKPASEYQLPADVQLMQMPNLGNMRMPGGRY